jgi:hypothetical protein
MGVVDAKQGKSDDGWEVLDDQLEVKTGVEGHASPRVILNDSVLREEDDQGWDETRREA